MDFVVPYRPRTWQFQLHQGVERFRWAVIVAHRRAGKTVALVNQLLKEAFACTLHEPFFAYVAPQYNQAKSIAWSYLKHFVSRIPGVKINEAELWVQLPLNRAKIRLFGIDNPDSLRGLYFDGIVLDEYADMHPDAWESVIRPALSDRQGWAVLSGTPRGHNSFYDAYLAALENPQWFCSVFRADEIGVLPPEELEALQAEMSEAKYRQEYLCDFDVADEDILIQLDRVIAAQQRELPKNNMQPRIGSLDVARFGNDMSILGARQGRDARSIPKERYTKCDTMQTAGHAMEYIRRHALDVMFVDGGGVGGGVFDRMNQLGANVIEVNFGSKPDNPNLYKNKAAEMWGRLNDWLPGGCLPPTDQTLVAQLTSRRYKYDVHNAIELEKKEELKKRGHESPDDADQLALTFAYPVQPADYAEQTAAYFGGRTQNNQFTSNGVDIDPLEESHAG